MTRGDYMIYKFFNEELDDMITEFFLPDDCVRRKLERLLRVQSYKERGYLTMGIVYVDRESYFNAKLNNTVEEYLYMDRQEQDVKRKFRFGQMTEDVAFKTLEMIQEHKWTLMKIIHHQIRRMIREDFTVDNEIALMIHDQYLKEIF